MKQLFGISQNDSDEEVFINWYHEYRGFIIHEENLKLVVANTNDLEGSLLSSLDTIKTQIFSLETPHHQIDIWESIMEIISPSI